MTFTGFLYCVSSDYTDANGFKKLGLTIYPVHRMRTYNTGDPPGVGLEKRYDGLWEVNATNKTQLARLEKDVHAHFHTKRLKRANGKRTEWFSVSLNEVCAYLNSQDYVVRQLSIDEVRVIQKKSEKRISKEEMSQYVEELSLIEEQQNSQSELKDEFFSTFLADGCIPRRNQSELWDLFEDICTRTKNYSGIIQWATGTGKTIGLLMLFVLSAQKCKREGRIFRGLLIAPKNDIFDTIIQHIKKVSKWDITVCEGHNARLSSLHIPHDKPVLITATHASLTEMDIWNKLPDITHCHYDEVHRITGDEFYAILNEKILTWRTQYLTGTSATPKTCSLSQHKKLLELFGNPLTILHKCDIDEAIHEGWIAQPRFGVHVISNTVDRLAILRGFINIIKDSIQSKKEKGLWKGGKVIAYLPSRDEVRTAITLAKEAIPDAILYTAVEDADAFADDLFVRDNANGSPRILFACERYREGSDIRGLEITSLLMGNTIGANVVLQVAGRALRNDYEGKEGWCILARPSEEGTTEDDVFESIVLQVMEFIGKDTPSMPNGAKTRKIITQFFGEVSIRGKMYNIDETVRRIQLLYAQKAFEQRSAPKEKYALIRSINKELGITSKQQYEECRAEHLKYIDNPKMYFRDSWVSWYDFLGLDTSSFLQTKMEWVQHCKDMGLHTWEDYKTKRSNTLPENPGEMYDDYTNWDKEMGIVNEEHVW